MTGYSHGWVFLSKLPEANRDLTGLVEELANDPDADPEVLADARDTYANSQYYMTWLMRLEGEGRDKWEPRIESARQTYKLLAQQAEEEGNEKKAKILKTLMKRERKTNPYRKITR